MKLPLILITIFFTNACSFNSLLSGSGDNTIEQKNDTEQDKDDDLEELKLDIENQVNIENIELKQARMWARIDELEGMLLKQREKVKMLEKGLLLGVHPKPQDTEHKSLNHPNQKFLRPLNEKKTGRSDRQKYSRASPTEQVVDLGHIKSVFTTRLQAARVLFKEGRFGKAYLEFAKLDREFESNVTQGETKYWLGRCWYKLKELQQAKQYFTKFINSFPTSPWVPSAKYYLARVELDSGLRQLAIKQLRSLIKEHPYEGSSEAAKQMLNNLNQNL